MDPSAISNDSGSASNYIEERITKSNGENSTRKYAKGKLLGKGGFAKCFQVTNLENNKVSAAKIIEKASLSKTRARQKLISEIKIHKSLRHTNVVSFEHVFEDQDNVYILLELCTNQTLSELIKRRKRLTELEVKCYLMQLINGLKYMHSNKIIHRDLKLGNLFVSDKMEIKIGDFGLAAKVEFEGEKKKTICGTPNYIAPEILEGKVGHSYEVDVWSVGVIIYTLLIGKPPFETPDVKTTYKKIRMNSYVFPDHIPLSDSAKSLISKTLTLDPYKRPTLDEMLAHSFMSDVASIPKLLPTSTIVCPPSASYIKQFLPQGSEVKLAVQPQRLIDTAPSSQQSNGPKLPSNQRNNLVSTERYSSNKEVQNNENNPVVEKQAVTTKADGRWSGTAPPGTMEFNMTGANGSARNFNSSQGFRPLQTASNLGNTGGLGNGFTKETYRDKGDIYVKKWVDYSSKYGLGYLLSNGAIGVFFNDSTKIILDSKGVKFNYVQRLPQDKQDVIKSHTMSDYPKDLEKKVTLLQHFRSYLEGENKAATTASDETVSSDNVIYVKKWMKTKHAIIFRLNNKVIQVDFADKTEIILSSENKMVIYVNKKGEKTQYPLATALESPNIEMTKRLKYAKEILAHILGPNQQAEKKVQESQGVENYFSGKEKIELAQV